MNDELRYPVYPITKQKDAIVSVPFIAKTHAGKNTNAVTRFSFPRTEWRVKVAAKKYIECSYHLSIEDRKILCYFQSELHWSVPVSLTLRTSHSSVEVNWSSGGVERGVNEEYIPIVQASLWLKAAEITRILHNVAAFGLEVDGKIGWDVP